MLSGLRMTMYNQNNICNYVKLLTTIICSIVKVQKTMQTICLIYIVSAVRFILFLFF